VTSLQLVVGFLVALGVLFLIGVAYYWRDRPNMRRNWRVISPHAQVPLGYCTYRTALKMASQLGKPSHVDHSYGLIFVDTHLGGSHENVPPGIGSGPV
jgi:hypothetical protein